MVAACIRNACRGGADPQAPTITHEVVWAFATCNHPGSQGELVNNDEHTNRLVAYIDDSEKGALRTTKLIYKCLDPEHLQGNLPKRSSYPYSYSADLQQRVLQCWATYGYPADQTCRARLACSRARSDRRPP